MKKEITHIPTEGRWDNIERLLRHIFSDKNTAGESLYDFGLDFIQRMFYNPKDKLPILVLASEKRGTGKTTFINFMKDIFQENAIIMGVTGFNSYYTDHYADKLLVCIDDDILGKNKIGLQMCVKYLATSDSVKLEAIGEYPQMIDNNLHFVLTTERKNKYITIAANENRFAVLRVNPIEEIDPLIREKCQKEIPYFLYYLKNRENKYPERKSWVYFDPKVYETETLRNIKKGKK